MMLKRIDIHKNEYLTPRQKAFLNANMDLRESSRFGREDERKNLVNMYDVYEADLAKKRFCESEKAFAKRALREGFAVKVSSLELEVAKEIERNTYTEHVFDDGTVIGEVERVSW